MTAIWIFLGTFAIPGIESMTVSHAGGSSVAKHPAPFNGIESYSNEIEPFYRWTGVLARMDADRQQPQPWKNNRARLKNTSADEMARAVNDIINGYAYKADIINWGQSDYWATPAEFFARDGDCEDFAISKYAWLRSLGITEDRLRIAIVHDRIRNLPHAVIILYIGEKAMILDNEVREIRDSNTVSRYRLLYSINRHGWWYPADPKDYKVSMNNPVRLSEQCLHRSALPECINALEPAAH